MIIFIIDRLFGFQLNFLSIKYVSVDETNQLANAILQFESFKQRQRCLSKSLDRLSFDFPVVYSLLFKEFKRRELEANDPYKIMKWLGTSKSNSFVKLHEAFMLVRKNNIIAKNQYLDNLQCMLIQTIETRLCIDEAVKICHLVENSRTFISE